MQDYHFSYQYMAQVLANAAKREDHETLDNSDIPKVFNVIFMFLGFSRGVNFNKSFLENQQLDSFFTFPLTNEHLELQDGFHDLFNTAIRAPKGKDRFIPADNVDL